VCGLLDQFRRGGILSLQYVDDTLLFSVCDNKTLRNLKCILVLFEKVSGMRIIFHKSEFIPMNLKIERIHEIAHTLNCHVGNFPCKYLGVPLKIGNLTREDLQPILDKLIKRMTRWRGKLLAYSNRLEQIKTCLASIPVYLLSVVKFPKWAITLLESQMPHCLWNNECDNHKYHLANWKLVFMKKEFGRLGVPNLRELNLCLLCSWVSMYYVDRDKIWKNPIHFKYRTCEPNIFTCGDAGASNFWKGVM
jgi:hypothetical protein